MELTKDEIKLIAIILGGISAVDAKDMSSKISRKGRPFWFYGVSKEFAEQYENPGKLYGDSYSTFSKIAEYLAQEMEDID